MPQGWKMELSGDRRRRGEVGQGGRDRRAGRGARLRLDLGLRPLPQRAPAGARGGVRVLDDDGRDQPAHQPRSASARWSAATRTGSRALLAKITSTIDVISRRPPRLGHRRRLVRERVQGLRLRVPRRRRSASACCARRVEIVKSMWTEPETTYDGKLLHDVTRANCDPKPVQQPHPPIWIGGGGEQLTLRVVARLRRLLATSAASPTSARHKCEVLKGHCDDVGPRLRRDPQDLVTRGVHPRDRGRGDGGRQPQSFWGEPVESWTRGQPRRHARAGAREASRPTSTSAAPGFVPVVRRLPRHRDARPCSPRRSCPSSAERACAGELSRSSGR